MRQPPKDENSFPSIHRTIPVPWRSSGHKFCPSTQMAEAAERFAHKPFVNDGILIEDMQREPM
jgi:hypothetical protein